MEWISPFLAVPWPKIAITDQKADDHGHLRELTAQHDGYQMLPKAVTHRRTVQLEKDGLTVIDHLSSNESHRYSLHWLLDAPEISKGGGDGSALRWLLTPRGDGPQLGLEISTTGAVVDCDFVRADPNSARGWQSRYYNSVEPAGSLRFTCTGNSVEIVSRFFKS
jgi:hypothetical protein